MDPNDRDLILASVALARGLPVPAEVKEKLWGERAVEKSLISVAHKSFEDFVRAMNPTLPGRKSLADYEHVKKLISVADRIVEGTLLRVFVLMPPRYFKTELFGKLLSAYYMLRHPRRHVGVSSYTAHRAWEISASARQHYVAAGGMLGRAQADERWQNAQGGELWAAGMGGAITGRGGHLMVLDDPIHPDHARSPAFRRRFADWWPQVWLSRQEPVVKSQEALDGPQKHAIAQLLVVMQRLGPEDPIDFLFRREVGEQIEEAPEHWHVVVMDEIKSDEPLGRWDGPRGLPSTCTMEPDDRAVGEALSPSRFPIDVARAAQRSAGPLTAAAQRQQRPMAATGDFWKSSWFGEYDVLPEDAHNGGWDWDTAVTKDEMNSAMAGILSYRGKKKSEALDDFDVYIEDVTWDWLEFPDQVKKLRESHGPHHIEEKSTGKSLAQTLKTFGVIATEVPVLGDKLARAGKAQPTVANGRVYVNRRVIQKLLFGERQGLLRVTAEALQGFGGTSEGLDVNDAFVQAIHRHLKLGSKSYQAMFR